MTKYLVKKLGGWLAIIFIATNITFFLATAFLDPKSNYVGRRPPLPEDQIQRTLQPLNLSDNTPLFERWWTWLSNILFHWDWGESPLGESVNQQISFRIWVSAELLLLATVLSVIIGVAIGVYTASNQYKMGDRIWQGISIVTMNLHIVVASIITVAFGLWVNRITGSRIFYVTGASKYGVHGFFPTLLDFLQHVALPTFSLLLVNYAGYHMMQRSLLLDNLNADYVRTARAKGLPRRKAIRKHALRTSIIPVATSVALSHNDIYGTVAVAAFGAFTTAVAAILADITVVILDPRVRVS